jgi:CRP-like cAMP-binding protein/Fe-S-cluster-containing hydrogenase component 2
MAAPVEIRLDRGEPLSPAALAAIPAFEGVAPAQWERYPGAAVLRRFSPGEIVCREGEHGSTAFVVLEGIAEVSIRSPLAHVETKHAAGGWLRRVKSRLAGAGETPRDGDVRLMIPVDAPVDLSRDRPVAELGPGSLFGEMTCLSFYPRSATVRARGELVVVEMLRNILQVLQRTPAFKKRLDDDYRSRALAGHLRSIPLFAALPESLLASLKDRVELVTIDPFTQDKKKNFSWDAEKAVVFREGDEADALYVVRIGFAKVSRAMPGGEIVLAYLGRGEWFGEMALLGGSTRTATVSALDHVELVKIPFAEIQRMMAQHPEVRAVLEGEAARRAASNRRVESVAGEGRPLDTFLSQGLMQAQSLLVLDLDKCTRCDDCVRACADTHDGITRLVREGLRYDRFLVATSCRQCRDPLCMIGCPVGSIRRKESLEIVIEDWCIGCGLCAKQCPYGNISMHPFEVQQEDPHHPGVMQAAIKEKATTCDLCTDQREPACVSSCPHEAAWRVVPREFFTAAE